MKFMRRCAYIGIGAAFVLMFMGHRGPIYAEEIMREGTATSMENSGPKDRADTPNSESGTVFDDFKSQMLSAVARHEKLVAENKKLKAQLIQLQLAVENQEQDIGQLREQGVYKGGAKPSVPQNPLIKIGLSGKDDRDLILEAQKIYLGGRFQDSDEGQKLRELLLYSLQFEKQELELDVELKSYWSQNLQRQRHEELEALKRETERVIEQEKEASLKVAEQEKMEAAYPREIELLRMENKRLQDRIEQLR